jgi:hypothetical protein
VSDSHDLSQQAPSYPGGTASPLHAIVLFSKKLSAKIQSIVGRLTQRRGAVRMIDEFEVALNPEVGGFFYRSILFESLLFGSVEPLVDAGVMKNSQRPFGMTTKLMFISIPT